MFNDIERKIKVYQIIENQIPEFILDESPKFSEFLKQYYISQEFTGGPTDISENLDEYLKLDNLLPEVIKGETILLDDVDSNSTVISVESTKGYPNSYGIFKIDDEIITYTSKTTTSFIGCIRGFSGITNYHQNLNYEELVFSQSNSSSHKANSTVINLSSLFLQEFYKKIKLTLTPGLENYDFVEDLNVGNFIKESRSLYSSKGTEESFRILFKVLYGIEPKLIDLENFLLKPSNGDYLRRDVIIIEVVDGNPIFLEGQTIFKEGDESTSASVSEVEVLTRKGKTYYKLLIFVGYDDSFSNISGKFSITAKTKVLENVSIGDSIINVDSTIGFPESGTIYYNNQQINYSEKSINQFYGCYTNNSNTIQIEIPQKEFVTSNDLYYGYEDGDLGRKVVFKITGTLGKLNVTSKYNFFSENDEIYVKSIGEKIENPQTNKNRKEVISNSFTYNTRSRYELDSIIISQSKIITKDKIDKSSIKIGDYVEFLQRETQVVESLYSNLQVSNINFDTNEIFFNDSLAGLSPNRLYDIRRNLNKSSSSIVPIKFGNNHISDIQNLYNEDDENLYVASNSLPSYEINTNIFKYQVKNIFSESYNPITKKYSILEFDNEVSFMTGDEIFYETTGDLIDNLENIKYYVQVLDDKKTIKLFSSKSFIGTDDFIEFGTEDGVLPSGEHIFVIDSQKENLIYPQKLLKKIKIFPNISNDDNKNELDFATKEKVGMLINGVEIINFNSTDKIYYGPLEKVDVLSGGTGYDVINPPLIQFSSGNALIQPVIKGSIEKIYIDPQEYDVDIVVKISVAGGNGDGAIFEPILEKRRREIEFDSRQLSKGGGIDIDYETITFTSKHNLQNGDKIIYDNNGNDSIGISTNSSNLDQSLYLIPGSTYYSKIVNDRTIQLYENFNDYSSGINTVRFTDIGNSGIHKFKTKLKNRLKEIKVIDGGNGYTNRKLIVKSSGISTFSHTVNFIDHGFKDGELIRYDFNGTAISGISTTNYYFVLETSKDSFRICDAGIDGKITSNFERKKYLKFSSKGSGYQIFKYPDISLNVSYSLAGIGSTQISGIIDSTPIIRGKIEQVYLYENGFNYGSNILNVHKKPSIVIKNGSSAEFTPIISNGKIIDVIVEYGGVDYYSTPDIQVYGSGLGAVLYPIIRNNKIIKIIVVNSGINYDENTTTIACVSSGSGAKFNPLVRDLTVNNIYKYGTQKSDIYREPAGEILYKTSNGLQYSILSYSENLKNYFSDTSSGHSPIIGWSYDGNPIYGPYGYSDPADINSPIKLLKSGYSEIQVENRPSDSLFAKGFFIEDYLYDGSGDLDIHNGRYCKTPEFPNGTYAYFATTSSDIQDNPEGNFVGKFPYFIGKNYKSKFIKENIELNQSFDFNKSNLIRNTFPYRINEKYSENDFIPENNEFEDQKIVVESVTTGKITGFDILESGSNYSVGDSLLFSSSDQFGGGLRAKVSKVEGEKIVSIGTTIKTYENVNVIWNGNGQVKFIILPSHDLKSGNIVNVYGLEDNLIKLNGFYEIGISTFTTNLLKTIPSAIVPSSGITTDILVSNIPSQEIYSDSLLSINGEIFKVLNVYEKLNVIRVRRSVGIKSEHLQTSEIKFIPCTFTINKKLDFFESSSDKKIYFNPAISIGVGTDSDGGVLREYYIAGTKYQNFIPVQSICIPNHKFKTNEKVILERDSLSSRIEVLNESDSLITNYILDSVSEEFYVINKSKDFIGIVTDVGLTTSTNGLYFKNFGTNEDLYSIRSTESQIKTKIRNINSLISISTSHYLNDKDTINLTVKPNSSVGIGTSSSVKVKYNSQINSIVFDYLNFNGSGINTNTSTIQLNYHNLSTSDKIFYRSNGGISTGIYYVYKVDDNTIKLSETKIDSLQLPPNTVSIGKTGGLDQNISLINPNIKVISNNSLVFDLSDSSLLGFDFKLYYDSQFKNEFISTGDQYDFNVSKYGSIGVGTCSLTLNYSEYLPKKLFYNLVKDGIPLLPDVEDINYSQIIYENSVYNGKYNVYGVGKTTFNISLREIPEKLNYKFDECDALKYDTNSKTAFGGISNIEITNNGSDYKSLPVFSGTNSKKGSGCYIIPKSNEIGKIRDTRIINEGFDYLIDKTLKPIALISSNLKIKSSNIVDSIQILNNGKSYVEPPDLIFIDSQTREIINSGFVRANLSGSIVSSVEIIEIPRGLPTTPIEIKCINNTNGIKIEKIESSSGIVTCTLITPINGFSDEPFKVGDEIFIENIEKDGEDGTGFNSSDYGYKFFKIISYSPLLNPRKLTYSLSGLTTNPGVAKTANFPIVINSKIYPQFDVKIKFSPFFLEETISSDKNDGNGFQDRQLIVKKSDENYLNILGYYKVSKNEILRGNESKNIATVEEINEINGFFDIDFFFRRNYGWNGDSGKLSSDIQVISDNDYYQNLSYTIKSEKEWNDIVTPVNSIIHSSGLKNFADTEITSNSGISKTDALDSDIQLVNIFASENRVDTINNLDLVLDSNVFSDKSKSLLFKNIKLSDYFIARTNRVLDIDDISDRFTGDEYNLELFSNIFNINPVKKYNNYLIQIKDFSNKEIQFVELSTIVDGSDILTLQKGLLSNKNEPIADIYGVYDSIEKKYYLKFDPVDNLNTDYDIKILNNEFITNDTISNKFPIGYVELVGISTTINPNVVHNVITLDSTQFKSIYSTIQLINEVDNSINYLTVYVTHDGTNSYISEYYSDDSDGVNFNYLGSFSSNLSSGKLSLILSNDENKILLRSKTIAFRQSVSSGITTYRFKSDRQPAGTEKTVTYDSYKVTVGSGSTIVGTYNKNLFSSIKTFAEVSVGSTIALHQIMTVYDGIDTYNLQYPYLSIGSTTGLGTFGSEIIGSNFVLRFYPETNFSQNINISIFNQNFYSKLDNLNTPNDLVYSPISESIKITNFYGVNSKNVNTKSFNLTYKGIPIFKKVFDPIDDTILNLSTGKFYIPNHFFSTGEKLTYTPKTTIDGGIASPLVLTDLTDLPNIVYAIKDDNDNFRLAKTQSDANNDISITFSSIGEGNAHELEMFKKNEKSVISINEILQYPIIYTGIQHTLIGNIDDKSNILRLSGISTVFINDILKIDEEYIKVTNVGFGTTSLGPITFTGTVPLVEVERESLGTISTSHSNLSTIKVNKGSYNIVGSNIHFSDPPVGIVPFSLFNLPRERASFTGRVFLRSDYSTNRIYDDISSNFNGIGQTFPLTINGSNVIGLGTTGGNGIVLINGIFQTPTTENNAGNNYFITEDTVNTKTNITFTGIRDNDNNQYITDVDVNQNEIPRGGLIISLGSTSGLGYAPLVGANVVARLSGLGTITSIDLPPLVVSNRNADAANLLDSNKNFIAYQAVDETLNNFTGFSIPPTVDTGYLRCIEDIKLILDAIIYNLLYGGNDRVYDAAEFYIENPTLLEGEIEESIYAYQRVAGISSYIINNQLYTATGINTFTQITNLSITPDPAYGPGYDLLDCSDQRSAIVQFVGIVTNAIGVGTLPTIKNLVKEPGSFGSGYRGPVSIGITDSFGVGNGASIGATVGAGGTLVFSILNGGIGYINPVITIPSPSYENLRVEGISRLSIGQTTETGIGLLLNIEVGASSTTGIGSTLFEVTSFKITRPGYSFQKGDVLRVVGLVTAKGLSSPLEEFKLTVLDTYSDTFAAWEFGELNYIDSVKTLQNGFRTRFPLFYNSELLSFERDPNDDDSNLLDFDALLVIFINGVLQKPKESYQFNGGTSFTFTEAPKKEDDIAIFFYVGTKDVDSFKNTGVTPILEIGDTVQVYNNNNIQNTKTQNKRVVYDLLSSDTIETNIYSEDGIDNINYKPLYFTKKKDDVIINGSYVFKSRDSIEPQIYPTARIIKNLSTSDTEIVVDDVSLFNYENDSPIDFDSIIIPETKQQISPKITAVVSSSGTISSLVINEGGSGYSDATVQVKISSPQIVSVGIGTTATATATATVSSAGTITTPITITNPGFGYTVTSPPNTIVELNSPSYEIIKKSSFIKSVKGTITGITSTSGIGTTKAIQFTLEELNPNTADFDSLVGYPLLIWNTRVGRGTTSIISNASNIIGIGTTCLDNVYYVNASSAGIITCNVSLDTDLSGISTTGTYVGEFSMGRISGFTRTSPISINVYGNTVDSGLSTYPTVQRRSSGLRNIGPLKKNQL